MIDRAPTAADARDLLAAEYVLGLTDPADLPQVEAFILRDAGFAALAAGWRARLAPLDFTAEPAAPSPRLWAGVEAMLGEEPSPEPDAAAPAQAPAEAVPESDAPAFAAPAFAAPAIEAPAIGAPAPRSAAVAPGAQRALAIWRRVGLIASLAAMLLAAGLGYFLQNARRQPMLVAVLVTPDGARPSAIVRAFADGSAELQPLEPIDVPPGKAIQIWTRWDPAIGPKSVGLIEQRSRAAFSLGNLPATQPGQTFEMTIEDAGGSPTGRPTGPVVSRGESAATP